MRDPRIHFGKWRKEKKGQRGLYVARGSMARKGHYAVTMKSGKLQYWRIGPYTRRFGRARSALHEAGTPPSRPPVGAPPMTIVSTSEWSIPVPMKREFVAMLVAHDAGGGLPGADAWRLAATLLYVNDIGDMGRDARLALARLIDFGPSPALVLAASPEAPPRQPDQLPLAI